MGLAVLLVAALVVTPAATLADEHEDSGGAPPILDVIFDVALLRPLGAVQTGIGLGFFAIAGPLSWPGGSLREAWDVFVGTPYEETFTRKLGRF